MKILVVHRQEMIVDMIKSTLQDNSPVVIHCDSGFDGLLTSRIESFDLIICGVDLPVVTGFEMVRSIRNSALNKNVPVIFTADELDTKTEYLAKALRVAGTMRHADIHEKLPAMVGETI